MSHGNAWDINEYIIFECISIVSNIYDQPGAGSYSIREGLLTPGISFHQLIIYANEGRSKICMSHALLF